MAITLSCSCGKQLKLKDELAGRKVKCPACQSVVSVPAAAEPPAEPRGGFDFSGLAAGAPIGKPIAPAPPVKPAYPGQPAEFHTPGAASKGLPKPVLFAAAGTLLLLIVGAGAWFLMRSSYDPYRYLPDGTVFAAKVDVDGVRNSELYKKLTTGTDASKGLEQARKETGIGPDDVRDIVVGGKIGGDPIFVLRLTRDIAADSLFPGKKRQETVVGDFKVFETTEPTAAFCVVEPDVVIFGKNAKSLQGVLLRKGRPEFSDAFRKALGELEGKRSFAAAIDVKAAGKGKPLPPGMPASVKSIEAAVVGADLSADLKLSVELFCSDDKNADDLRKMAEGLIASQKGAVDAELKKLLDTVKITASGSKLSGEAVIAGATIEGFAKNPLAAFGLLGALGSLSGPDKAVDSTVEAEVPATPEVEVENTLTNAGDPNSLWSYNAVDGGVARTVLAAARSADGSKLLTFAYAESESPQAEFVMWESASGKRTKSWKDDFKATSLAISVDGGTVAALGKGGAMLKHGVRFYGAGDGSEQGTFEFSDNDGTGRVEFDATGQFVYVAGKTLRRVFRSNGRIADLRQGDATAFGSAKGSTMVINGGKVFEYRTPQPSAGEMPSPAEIGKSFVPTSVIAEGRLFVVSGTNDGNATVFVTDGNRAMQWPLNTGAGTTPGKAAISGDIRFVAVAFGGGIWIGDRSRSREAVIKSVGAEPLLFTPQNALLVRTLAGIRFVNPATGKILTAMPPRPVLPPLELPL